MLQPMRPATLTILQDEHQALAAMLRSMGMLLQMARREGHLPDFSVLRAMLFYVDEFPERQHHRRETEYLFPLLRARCPELAAVLQRLDQDHHRSEKSIRDLQHALLAFEVLGEPRREAFEQACQLYTRQYLEHMALEEREVLPAAQRSLGADDWARLDAIFEAGRDPLTLPSPGEQAPNDYAPLFSKILMQTPAPIGLGPATR